MTRQRMRRGKRGHGAGLLKAPQRHNSQYWGAGCSASLLTSCTELRQSSRRAAHPSPGRCAPPTPSSRYGALPGPFDQREAPGRSDGAAAVPCRMFEAPSRPGGSRQPRCHSQVRCCRSGRLRPGRPRGSTEPGTSPTNGRRVKSDFRQAPQKQSRVRLRPWRPSKGGCCREADSRRCRSGNW